MNLPVTLRGALPAAYLDLTFEFQGETYGATLEGAEAREGHCASRLQLIDSAVRNPDGWFDVPLSDRRIDEATLHKALAIILQEHFAADIAAFHVSLTP